MDATGSTLIVRCKDCGRVVVIAPIYQVIKFGAPICNQDGRYDYFTSFKSYEDNKPDEP